MRALPLLILLASLPSCADGPDPAVGTWTLDAAQALADIEALARRQAEENLADADLAPEVRAARAAELVERTMAAWQGLAMTLVLSSDGTLTLTAVHHGRPGTRRSRGAWSRRDDGSLLLVVKREMTAMAAPDHRMTADLEGDLLRISSPEEPVPFTFSR